MIRPSSEIQYPPNEALCIKAKMIARMERLSEGSESIVEILAQRLGSMDRSELVEIQRFNQEQRQLLENMKRIIKS